MVVVGVRCRSVAEVGGGRRLRSVEVDVRVSCGVVWCSGVVVV